MADDGAHAGGDPDRTLPGRDARPGAEPAVGVRRGRTGDLDGIVHVFETVAAEGTWIGGEAPVDWTSGRLETFRAQLASDDATGALVVATAGDEVVGWIGLLSGRSGTVDFGMALLAEHRGRGLGGALLDAGVAWARHRGAPKIACQVWPHNTPAIRLYLSRGFAIEGRLRRHWRRRSGQRWDGVLMGLVLDHESPGSGLPDSPLLQDTPAQD